MITLAAGGTLQGKAGTASAVTYTVNGDSVAGGNDTFQVLGQEQLGTSTAGLVTTVPAGTVYLIKDIHLSNTTGSSVSITLYVNGTAAANQLVNFSIPANGLAVYGDSGWSVTDANGNLQTAQNVAFGPVGSSPNADGATISSGLITLQPANATYAGLMSAANYSTISNLVPGIHGWIDVTQQSANPILTTNSGATNVTNLNAILSAAGSGSTIYFPGGTYQFNAGITVPAKSFVFQGQGSNFTGGYTILQLTTVATGFISLTSGSWYSQFRDLTFNATVQQTSGAMVAVNNNVATNFRNCAFTGGGTAATPLPLYTCIDYTGANAGNTSIVDGCQFSVFSNAGINFNANGMSCVVTSCVISGQWSNTANGASSNQFAAAGINITQGGALQLDNCDLIGATNNLLLNPTSGLVIASVYVTNTYMDYANGSCLKISGAGATVRCRFIAVSFTTNNISTSTSAIEISTSVTAGAQGIDFENCSVLNTFGTTGTTNGFNVTGGADFAIIACRIAGWTNGINVTPMATAGTTQPFIANNTIGPTGGFAGNGTGILLNAGSAQYGTIIITDNQLVGNTTSLLTDNSTQATTTQKILTDNTGLPTSRNTSSSASSFTVTTTETVVGTLLVPAQGLRAGQVYRFKMYGTMTATAATVTARVRFGTTLGTGDTLIGTVAPVTTATASEIVWEFQVVARSATSLMATGHNSLYGIAPSTTNTVAIAAPAAVTVANTAASGFTLTATASAGTLTVVNVIMECVQQ